MDEMLTREILDDLAEIVAIPSVYSEPKGGAPYGEACLDALKWFVNKAHSYGLNSELMDGYCAYAEVGSGEECIGILGHLDVVPAGNGWASDPFKMVEEDGKVYGRGVGDDKGAVVVCLHALRSLKNQGAKLNRRVRLIVGADEERGSSCIRYYLANGGEVPAMSFVPDSEFPVINSEKGIAHIILNFTDEKLSKNIAAITGAECANAVPDKSTVSVVAGSPLQKYIEELCGGTVTAELFKKQPIAGRIIEGGNSLTDYEIYNGKNIDITAVGTAEHASTPDKGDNALWKTLGLLSACNEAIGAECLPGIYEYLCASDAAQRLGVYVNDPKSGNTTMCLSQAELDCDTLKLLIDFRLPLGVTAEDVAQKLEEKTGCKAVVRDYHENLYIAEDAPLITALLEVYRSLTGDMTQPLQVGGGTYARELPNAVAFGCTPLGVDINMHRADENFPVRQLFKNYEIYLAAAKKLANM
ncbi:MAG: Sapep family Mn(2+)-dependent dipeptidase [Clostridiales bacterium]|nr:Sapep family Mn(2+)-dependent dipeptidase [Clostridiales bacterium]